MKNTIETVLAKLVEGENGCRVWTGSKVYGYGHTTLDGKSWRVHRLVYEHFKGLIPEGLVIDHLCRNRACANPDHLEAVTQKVNFNRAPNGMLARTHCPAGHPYEGDNLVIKPDGKRRCRTCHAKHAKERAHQKAQSEGRPVPIGHRSRTHCPSGHEYTPENTGRTSTGWRYCSTCNRERAIEGHHRRMEQQGRKVAVAPKDRTHCPHGHPYAGENLIRKKDGSRACRECKRLRRSKQHERLKK